MSCPCAGLWRRPFSERGCGVLGVSRAGEERCGGGGGEYWRGVEPRRQRQGAAVSKLCDTSRGASRGDVVRILAGYARVWALKNGGRARERERVGRCRSGGVGSSDSGSNSHEEQVMGDVGLAGHSLRPFNVTAGQSEGPHFRPRCERTATRFQLHVRRHYRPAALCFKLHPGWQLAAIIQLFALARFRLDRSSALAAATC